MRVFLSVLLLAAVVTFVAGAVPDRIAADGEYIGLEPIAIVTPDQPADKWFHENRLVIRNDEAILDKLPVTIHKGMKLYSASEGGFLTYRARFIRRDGKTFLSARLFQSEYVDFSSDAEERYQHTRIHEFPVKLFAAGMEINGVRFRRTVLGNDVLEALLHLLASELLEKGH